MLWQASLLAVNLRPGEVRIIGGQWRRTPIKVLDAQSLRPTPDRVRETLFNWLGHDLSGWSCVDLFAGTGVLGFEAASRGAAKVWLFEQSAPLVLALETLKAKLKAASVHIKRGDGLSLMSALEGERLDLVFIDPPYADVPLYPLALRVAAKQLALTGRIYLESPRAWGEEELRGYGLSALRYLRAGSVHAHLLQSIGT